MKNQHLLYLLVSIFFISCNPNCNNSCSDLSCYKNSKRPSKAITYKEMAAMFNEYDTNHKRVLDDNLNRRSNGNNNIETISTFYTINELKQYIAYVERLSKEKEIPLTGIRIFNAAYPKDYSIEAYRNRMTLILAPTTDINGKANVAYEPLYSDKGAPIPITEFLHKFSSETTKNVNRASMVSYFFQSGDLKSSGLNRGEVSPPPY